MPSLGSAAEVAVTSTWVSPQRTTTEPPACLAKRPVSSVTVLPSSSNSTVCFMIPAFSLWGFRCVQRKLVLGLAEKVARGDTRPLSEPFAPSRTPETPCIVWWHSLWTQGQCYPTDAFRQQHAAWSARARPR